MEQTPGRASDAVSATIAAYIAAMNRGDPEEIAAHVSAYRFRDCGDLRATGVAIVHDAFVVQPLQWSRSERGTQVFELNDEGLIARQWALGPVIA